MFVWHRQTLWQWPSLILSVSPISMPLSSKSKQSILCWPRLCVHRYCLKLLFIWHAVFQDASHLWWLHCPPVYLLGCFPWMSNVIHMSNSKYTYLYFYKSLIENMLLTNPEPTPGLGIFNVRINLNAKVQVLARKRWNVKKKRQQFHCPDRGRHFVGYREWDPGFRRSSCATAFRKFSLHINSNRNKTMFNTFIIIH